MILKGILFLVIYLTLFVGALITATKISEEMVNLVFIISMNTLVPVWFVMTSHEETKHG